MELVRGQAINNDECYSRYDKFSGVPFEKDNQNQRSLMTFVNWAKWYRQDTRALQSFQRYWRNIRKCQQNYMKTYVIFFFHNRKETLFMRNRELQCSFQVQTLDSGVGHISDQFKTQRCSACLKQSLSREYGKRCESNVLPAVQNKFEIKKQPESSVNVYLSGQMVIKTGL